jgi:hypothetical protein
LCNLGNTEKGVAVLYALKNKKKLAYGNFNLGHITHFGVMAMGYGAVQRQNVMLSSNLSISSPYQLY